MKIFRILILSGLLTAGCASFARVDTATMPPGTFAAVDVDLAALAEASQILGLNAPPPTSVQMLARGMADVEYVSGAFNTHARWIGMNGLAQADIMIARREMRDAIGISQQTSSQAVVDALLAVSRADTAPAMRAAFSNPVFSLGAAETQARMQAPPKLFTTPYAIARMNRASNDPEGTCSQFYC